MILEILVLGIVKPKNIHYQKAESIPTWLWFIGQGRW
jgi:hypothetical protein